NAVAHRGGELLHVEHEAAVAAERHDGHVAAERVLGAERGGDAPAERALVARGDERARLARLLGRTRGGADLGQFLDQHAIVGHAASAAIRDDGCAEPVRERTHLSGASSAPPPTKITGHSALARRSAARSIASSSSGATPSSGKGGSNSTSARAASISGGT